MGRRIKLLSGFFFLRITLITGVMLCSLVAQSQSVSPGTNGLERATLEAQVRASLKAMMEQNKLDDNVISARLSWAVKEISNRVEQEKGADAILKKILDNDSALLKRKPASGSFQQWQRELKSLVSQAIAKGTNFESPILANDFSDRILIFHTDISVNTTGELMVHEAITVYNGNGQSTDANSYQTNNDIIRGITRDIPTKYVAANGLWSAVDFDLKSVLHNGRQSPYHTEPLSNGTRILIGDADVYLEEGIHRYEIIYTTNRQLIHHPDKTELYWNVNGNGWAFSADSISCNIRFPNSTAAIETACYTGYAGDTASDCSSTMWADGTVHFGSKKFFQPWEGMTVAAAIPAGIIAAPLANKYLQLAKDNYGLVVLAALLLLVTAYNFFIWIRKGKDPPKGSIYPQFEPPKDLSPADAGFIYNQGYGHHLFAAAIVDMAVHNQLRVEVEKGIQFLGFGSTEYQFKPATKGDEKGKQEMEKRYGFYPALLHGQTAKRGEYNSTLHSRSTALESRLKQLHQSDSQLLRKKSGSFALNHRYLAVGIFMMLALELFGIFYLVNNYTPQLLTYAAVLMIAALIIQLVFASIIKAYSPQGRLLADHIEGFRMYLKEAEQPLYNELTPPKQTLDLFEKYLPFAIALKVENQWAKKFESQLQQAISEGYQPNYYRSSSYGGDFSAGNFSQSFASGLSSTVASASTPPSSSSGGSSGGGSSGGGGGGGGGGGW